MKIEYLVWPGHNLMIVEVLIPLQSGSILSLDLIMN